MTAVSREAGFGATIETLQLDDLWLHRLLADAHVLQAAPAARDRAAPLLLACQQSSPWSVRQGERKTHLRPGDVVLLDTGAPFELHFTESCGCLVLRLPRAWLAQWLARVDAATVRVAWREHGWGRTLSALCLQLGEVPSQALAYPDRLFTQHLGGLLAAAFEPAEPALRAEEALVTLARAVMKAQVNRPGLTAGDIASEMKVSLRSLQRAFAAQGLTVAGALRELRMHQAAELLARPALRQLSTAEVGMRCGYSDASHFSREFRRAWGAAPAQWRRTQEPLRA